VAVESLHESEARKTVNISEIVRLAVISAANDSEPRAFPLVFAADFLTPTVTGFDPRRAAFEGIVLEGLSQYFAPGRPGGRARHQIGLNGATLSEILTGVSFSSPQEHLGALASTDMYPSLIAESQYHGNALSLMAGRFSTGALHMAIVTRPGILPAMSGA